MRTSFGSVALVAPSGSTALGAFATAFLVATAFAEETQSPQPSLVGPVEEVFVVGIRGALRRSIDVKRDSDGVVDAITEEDIGKFPDKNVAESLQRITGVTIQRQFGEGQGVAIRGASQNMTLTTLNGQNVASTGWFAFEPARRSFNYSLLPSELVGNIKVHKSSQADLVEGGIGGTVVINTRKPLDVGDASVYAAAQGAHTSDSGSIDPQLSGLASWENEEGNLGLLVSGVYQGRELQRMGNEAFWPWGAGPVGFQQDRQRSAINAIGQLDLTEKLTLTGTWLDMQMRADNTNYALWLTKGDADTQARGGASVAGALNAAFYQARPREATMAAAVYDLKAEYSGDRFLAELQFGNTDSSGGTDFEMVINDSLTPSLAASSYDFTGGSHSWSLAEIDFESYDPGILAMGTGPHFNKTPKTDEETYLQADLDFDIYRVPVAAFKTGIRFAEHETASRLVAFRQRAGFDPTFATAGMADGLVEVGLDGRQILALDVDAIRDWAKASIVGEDEDLTAHSRIEESNSARLRHAHLRGRPLARQRRPPLHSNRRHLGVLRGRRTHAVGRQLRRMAAKRQLDLRRHPRRGAARRRRPRHDPPRATWTCTSTPTSPAPSTNIRTTSSGSSATSASCPTWRTSLMCRWSTTSTTARSLRRRCS